MLISFSLTEFATSIQNVADSYLSSAPITVQVSHCLSPEEVKRRMVARAQTVRAEFLPEHHWEQEYLCTFSGCAAGTITISQGEVEIIVRLSPALSLFRAKVENDLPRKLELLLGDHFEGESKGPTCQ